MEAPSVSYTPASLINLLAEVAHTPPGSDSPNLAEADTTAVIDGAAVEPVSGEGIDAVALALTQGADTLTNDVITSRAINARTEWAISYPLDAYKRYRPFSATIDGQVLECDPFGDRSPAPGAARVDVPDDFPHGVISWGAGEYSGYELDVTPIPERPQTLTLCHSVNVVPFGDDPPFLVSGSSELVSSQPDPIEPSLNGDASVLLRWRPFPEVYPENSGIPRPVLGFRMTTFQNGVLDGGPVLRNYSVLRQHQRH
jgi:hypothetical protein